MFCIKCGTKNEDYAKFCTYCGTLLYKVKTIQANDQQETKIPEPKAQPKAPSSLDQPTPTVTSKTPTETSGITESSDLIRTSTPKKTVQQATQTQKIPFPQMPQVKVAPKEPVPYEHPTIAKKSPTESAPQAQTTVITPKAPVSRVESPVAIESQTKTQRPAVPQTQILNGTPIAPVRKVQPPIEKEHHEEVQKVPVSQTKISGTVRRPKPDPAVYLTRKTLSSLIFFAAAAFFALTVIVRFIGTIASPGYGVIDNICGIFNYGSLEYMLSDLLEEAYIPSSATLGFVYKLANILTLTPMILLTIGIAVTAINATNRRKPLETKGLNLIKAGIFAKIIFVAIESIVSEFLLIILYIYGADYLTLSSSIFPEAESAFTVLFILGSALVTIVLATGILYLGKAISTVNTIKKTVSYRILVDDISLFVAVMSFIIGAAKLIAQFFTELSACGIIAAVFEAAAFVLLGIFLFDYKKRATYIATKEELGMR